MKKSSPEWKEADRLWSQYIKERAGYRCQVEGCGRTSTDAHHVISRGCSALRFDLRNGVALCRNHHNHSSLKMLERGIEIIGFEMYQEICFAGRELKQLRTLDLEEIAERLKAELKRLKEVKSEV